MVVASWPGRQPRSAAQPVPRLRLSLDPIGGLYSEAGFGPVSQTIDSGPEGALFSGFVVMTIILLQRGLAASWL